MNTKNKLVLGAVAGLVTLGAATSPLFAGDTATDCTTCSTKKPGFFSRLFGGNSEKVVETATKDACSGKDGCGSKDKCSSKDSCSSKDGCSSKETATAKDSCSSKDGCSAKETTTQDSCSSKDGCSSK